MCLSKFPFLFCTGIKWLSTRTVALYRTRFDDCTESISGRNFYRTLDRSRAVLRLKLPLVSTETNWNCAVLSGVAWDWISSCNWTGTSDSCATWQRRNRTSNALSMCWRSCTLCGIVRTWSVLEKVRLTQCHYHFSIIFLTKNKNHPV